MPLNPLYKKVDRWVVERNWNAERIAKWEKTRARGFWKYVLPWAGGFLGLGVAMAVAYLIFDKRPGPLFLLAIPPVIGLMTGFRYGWSNWSTNERQYKIAIENAQPPD
jgi:hypothetical protein